MSRRHAAEPRPVDPEAKYGSILLAKFIKSIMVSGKKSLAEKIAYGALDIVKNKHQLDPMEAFNAAINNVRPQLEVVSVRVGGANYQVPSPVETRRGDTLAIRWIIKALRKRSEKTTLTRLAEELADAYNNRGGAIKIKEDMHKMAESNKAFAHFSPKKGKN